MRHEAENLILSVHDEGAGPPAGIRDHLFEPFVTGRADGTAEKRLQTYLRPHLLVIDDFGLKPLPTPHSAADFYDVTTGNNGAFNPPVAGYNATTGWDPVTGLGTPNAANLLPDLIAYVNSH